MFQQPSKSAPEVMLTELKRFNRLVWPAQEACELCIEQPIHTLTELPLNHRDDIIGLKWAAEALAEPDSVSYAYRLLGLEEQWNIVSSSDRNITYTSLRSGDYTFQVKASFDGIHWHANPLNLNIHVSPAPWFSPWAFAAYTMVLIVLVVLIIKNRTRAAHQRAEVLEQTVSERTFELKDRNEVIASLLKQKNALFANITHEFKTPLTLILGPLNKLKKYIQTQNTHTKQAPIKDLDMIDRNANRLLMMIGHLLKLSEAEDDQAQQKVTVHVAVVTAMIIDSFKPLAEQKQMTLTLETTDCPADAAITMAPESLEIILGNLVSNAIKYGHKAGHIHVSLRANEDQITVICKDDGPGIALSDQEVVFERFGRLSQHAHIEGNGIGLAVVKQLVAINGGQMQLDSDTNQGTAFTISIPRSFQPVSQQADHATIESLAKNTLQEQETENIAPVQSLFSSEKSDKPDVLIIEDNRDMRQYILSELNLHFNCHVANNGQEGVEACIKVIPDIVISDVMMPVMDGYEVAHQLRGDQRTSHIPIVLLTALNTTQSRIKGWQEHIDSYITKPFDSSELLIRLRSILAIRELLKSKNAQRFGNHVELDLPEIDNAFITKLRKVITNHYADPNFQRQQMASEMAISERQLLRKTKALINISPMDALRDYRLEQAVKVLKTGKPVNLVSDTCGFNSPSYFVKCFKSKYDTTPKQFQKQLQQT